MKFVADVNIAQKVTRLLRRAGHDVVDVKKLDPKTADTEIIKLAREESRIILTHDKDFLGLTKFPEYQVGIIVIRLNIQSASHHYKKLIELLEKQTENVLNSSLTILTEEVVDSHPYIFLQST